jgi:DNA polymerase III delta subunit
MKNLIYITGNDSYGVELEVKRWIGVFQGKYGDINIERIRLENRADFAVIRDNLTTTGLFTDKRLFLFSGGIDKKSKTPGLEEILEKIVWDIPEDHFCIFHNLSLKEEWLRDWLKKKADVRTIDTLWEKSAWIKRFPDTWESLIQKMLHTYRTIAESQEAEKSNPFIGHAIANSIESITLAGTLSEGNLDEHIRMEWGGKMFDLVDMILGEKVRESILLLRKMVSTMSYAELTIQFLPSLIGLFRSHLYIKFLSAQGKNSSEISSIIKVHPFVLKKSLASRISPEKLGRFFTNLIEVNKAYKSGKWLQDAELWRIFWIELAIMGLKK